MGATVAEVMGAAVVGNAELVVGEVLVGLRAAVGEVLDAAVGGNVELAVGLAVGEVLLEVLVGLRVGEAGVGTGVVGGRVGATDGDTVGADTVGLAVGPVGANVGKNPAHSTQSHTVWPGRETHMLPTMQPHSKPYFHRSAELPSRHRYPRAYQHRREIPST